MAENQGNETGKGAKRQRRQISAAEKRRLLDETEKPGESVSTVARRYSYYNRVRPHKGLRMLSPVEFRNAQLAS